MAHAYTPGLKVTPRTTLRRHRVLPLAGEVLVEQGEHVEAASVIAEAQLPGPVHPVNVVNRLGIRPGEVRAYMLKLEGDQVGRNEPIAETRPWLKFLKTVCRSPVEGTVESVSEVTGQVMLREPPQKVQVRAYVAGTVAELLPGEGAIVQTEAALVQGIFGVGGECNGQLKMLAQAPDGVVQPAALDSTCQNCIIVVGSLVTAELVEAARSYGVAAIVAGGMAAQDLRRVLGYEIGVAVTGAERIGLTIVLTEGFGSIPMARRTFDLLDEHERMDASVSGATQIRAGVVRPEVIVPLRGAQRAEAVPERQPDGLREGDQVRIIRQPWLGVMGEVTELIPDLVKIETEAYVRALRVRAWGDEILTVPRANVEVIQA